MENIQEILNKIQKSDIASTKTHILESIKQRKPIFVFKDGLFIEKLPCLWNCEKKYGPIRSSLRRRNINRNGYFFSYQMEYNPKKTNYGLWLERPIIVKKNNILIGEFESVSKFSKLYDLPHFGCYKAAQGRYDGKYKGYVITYKK